METNSWESIGIDKINIDINDILSKLVPVLRTTEIGNTSKKSINEWGRALIEKCKSNLSIVLPFAENEAEFLCRLQQDGVIEPKLLTKDKKLQEIIINHPSLKWRVQQQTL